MQNEQKIGYRIIEDIQRPEASVIERVREYNTGELCDGMLVYSAMDHRIKPMVTTKKICGPAVTLKLTLGDSLLVTKAISLCKPGDVLVIEGKGSMNNALWGDHRSRVCKLLGLEGVVIDGAFRDIDENEEIGFPIYAKSIACGSSTKNSNGEINVPICCGGVTVNPGDIVVGDRNGVCVVPQDQVDATLKAAQQKRDKMEALTDEIEGELKIIPDNFAETLRKLGYPV